MKVKEKHAGKRMGKPLTGQIATALVNGGTFKTCDCRPPKDDSYGTYPGERKWNRNQSCKHSVGKLMFHMAICKWTKVSAKQAVFDKGNLGMAWMQEVDPEQELFEQWWVTAEALADKFLADKANKPKSALHQSGQSQETMDTNFVCHYSLTMRMLRWIEANPGAGTNEIKDATPGRDGHAYLYLEDAKARGFVRFEEGKRKKHHHYVVAWPEPPARRPKSVASKTAVNTLDLEALLAL